MYWPRPFAVAAAMTALVFATGLSAKDSLGVFGQWGAFRDASVPRCYAIAVPEKVGAQQAFVSVGTWPRRNVRGQLHVRLSRPVANGRAATLTLDGRSFVLKGSGANAWAQDSRMDSAIVAAMRSAPSMTVTARDEAGRRFSDRYTLEGAATALDAATIGCARR